MHEFRTALTAIMFYTVVPVPAFEFRPDYLQRILRYSSLVGAFVGGVGALVYSGFLLIFPGEVAILLTLFSTAMMTGCLHEDGFADFCDGISTPGSRMQKLAAMRDSRIGRTGATGLVLMLLLRFTALAALPPVLIPLALVASHSISRFVSASYVFDIRYASAETSAASTGSDGTPASGAKPTVTRMTPADFIVAGCVAAVPFLFFPGAQYFAIVPALIVAYWIFRRILMRTLYGYTGDCLGAAQQIFEVTIYLTFVAVATATGTAIV